MKCNPTKHGIILRLVIASLLIGYGVINTNYIILAIGLIPPIRLGFYFLTHSV